MLLALGSVNLPVSAQAGVGSLKGCKTHQIDTQTNDWSFFFNHKIRVHEKVCRKLGTTGTIDYLWLKYAGRPKISLVSRGRPSTETVSVTQKPFVSEKDYYDGKLKSVRWAFQLKSCSIWTICQDWEFTFLVDRYYTQICVEKGDDKRTCDDKKSW